MGRLRGGGRADACRPKRSRVSPDELKRQSKVGRMNEEEKRGTKQLADENERDGGSGMIRYRSRA
eukprot:2986546-Pleurochrysis_carterae.AAC.2